jgi:ATP-dependent DNA helicase RecQ
MLISVAELQSLIGSATDSSALNTPTDDSIAERIRHVLRGDAAASKKADLPPLIRQFLLRESGRRGNPLNLRVPAQGEWPDENVWRQHSVSVHPVGRDFLLTAQPWMPLWLQNGQIAVFADAFSDVNVRANGSCPADPFIQDATGFETYSCPGQREAVRAALLMPPGETLIINLPTGSGKSLAGHAPALIGKQDGSLTVFVVPTVALAADQEVQLARILSQQGRPVHPFAWYGGTPADVRQEIWQRIRAGSQRILFTSPESLIGPLLNAVIASAELGMLRYLVVDEAHLVSQWGDEFRPAFQALSGLRNNLLRRAPKGHEPRTLLLSATFTQDTIDTLTNLFGPEDKVQMVSAVYLRPEPQYWFYKAASAEDKREKIVEALRHAPRPFILYVTKRNEARQWMSWLRELGLTRIARFDGEVSADSRTSGRVLDDWRANHLDGVVATSAFGVGIDKADVRTIIHASIPETLDRFYQEVGRAGRDGRPSVSLLVHEASDWHLPRRLAMRKIVSEELGLERWRAMFQGGCAVSDGVHEIDLRAIRQRLSGDSEYNLNWNIRTLLLLCRAGLIELDIGPQDHTSESPHEDRAYFAPISRVTVRVKDYSHLQSETWIAKVRPARELSAEAGLRSLSLMRTLLANDREVSDILAELYTIHTSDQEFRVVRVCGGCPRHRTRDAAILDYQCPAAAPLSRVYTSRTNRWLETFPYLPGPLVFVFYPGQSLSAAVEPALLRLVEWLVASCGITELAVRAASAFFSRTRWQKLYKHAESGVLIHRLLDDIEEEPYSPLPRLSVYDIALGPTALAAARTLVRPLHLIALPMETRDPSNGNRLLLDTTLCGARLDDLLARLSE